MPFAAAAAQPAVEAAVSAPPATLPLTVTVAVALVSSGSVTVIVPNGATLCTSLIEWASCDADAPPSTGTSLAAVTVTPGRVSAALAAPSPSVTATEKPVVALLPGAMTWATGWNTRASTAACAAAPTLVCAAKLRV